MEASLAVPTATSQRRIPVRLLDENRRIINRHLEGKPAGARRPYTSGRFRTVARAGKFPQINDGYEVIDGQPFRVKRESVNLGIAIDLEKERRTTACWFQRKEYKSIWLFRFLKRPMTMSSCAPAPASCRFLIFRGPRFRSQIQDHWNRSLNAAFDGRSIGNHRHRRY